MLSRYICHHCLKSLEGGMRRSVFASKFKQTSAHRWQSTLPRPNLQKKALAQPKSILPATRRHESGRVQQFVSQEEPGVEQGSDIIYELPTVRNPSGVIRRRDGKSLSGNVLLEKDNLFHHFSTSPSPDIRRRAAFMKTHAYCPHPSHHRTRMPTSPKDLENRKTTDKTARPPAFVKFECPDCGIPVACCEEHWTEDYESHMELCETLRQINQDDHDLRSGRFFPEFQYPYPGMEEALPNMSNWDTYLYTREYNAINEERSLRHATRLLTYPITIASIIHELSPYNIRKGGRLTTEGLKSLSALRYTLHPPKIGAADGIKGLRFNPPPVRIFVLGARAESSLPREVWQQLTFLFPRVAFHLILIGPEAMLNRDAEFPLPERTPTNPFGAVLELVQHELKISTYVEYFHTLHAAQHFYPYDPYFDCFVLFHPGLGHPASSHEWKDTVPQLLETKCPVICTGYTEWDMQRDKAWMEKELGSEMDVLMEPGENKFRSLRWDLNDYDPADVSCGNWGVWAWRGKRYDAERVREGPVPERLESGYDR